MPPELIRFVGLWHMHQPDYRLPGTPGRAAMPWTRLHAAKDYVDIVQLLGARDDVRMAVNVVPVLLDQLHDIACGGTDPLMDAARAAGRGDATPAQRALLVRSTVTLPYGRMLPESARLPVLCGELEGGGGTASDLRDLAVLLHLAWTGPLLRREPLIAELIARDGGFAAGDLDRLLDRMTRRAAETPRVWAELARRGTLEFSTTPYNHPILPLLCDLSAAEAAREGCSVEGVRFQRPQDAERQVRDGLRRASDALGCRVRGLWPSEGAVSEAALEAIAAAAPDLRWLATDRAVLAKSLGSADDADPLRPWRIRGEGPAIFFRDTRLSDRIGFVYAGMPAEEAVADFLAGIRAIAAAAPSATPPTVCVVLDGENCWEHYEGGGEPFLRALVDGLGEAQDIVAVTPSEALAASDREGATGRLQRIATGSWIRGDLDTWAGHPEKNAAWRRLAAAADAFDEAASRRPAVDLESARLRLLRAQGSDWFWWLGDDHPTPWKREFHALFRAHVASVYEDLGMDPPAEPKHSVAFGRPPDPLPVDVPFGTIRPTLTGETRGHFAWWGAARLPEMHRDGAMHGSTPSVVRELQYGWDTEHLYMRLMPRSGRLDTLLEGGSIEMQIDDEPVPAEKTRVATGAVWEAAVPRGLLRSLPARVRLILRMADGSVTRVPARGPAVVHESTNESLPACVP